MAPRPDLALLFPGQGSQKVGMGLALWEASPSARRLFQEADAILGYPLSQLMFYGTQEALTDTANAQPAIFVCSLAYLLVAIEAGLISGRPQLVAGHSLGEYTALVAAGSLEWEEALRLVQIRGKLMAQAAEERPGSMVAVMGLSPAQVEEICQATGAEVANYNSPQQTVVGGPQEAIREASRLAKERGGKAVPLVVSGAFHTSLMDSAAQGLEKALAQVSIKDAVIPIVGNVTAAVLTKAHQIYDELKAQLTSPVRWLQGVKCMEQKGISTFLEVGPGQVITGLVKRCAPHLQAYSLEAQILAGVKT